MPDIYKIIETIRQESPHIYMTIKYVKDLDNILDQLDTMVELENISQDLRLVISDLKRHLGHKIYMIYSRQKDNEDFPDEDDEDEDV